MNVWKLLSANCRMILRTPRFYLAILLIGFTASIYLLFTPEIALDVKGAYEYLFYSAAIRKILPLFAAFPFTSQFAHEWNSHMTDSILIRSGTKAYWLAHCLTVAISTFFVVVFGLFVFLIIGLFHYPLFLYQSENIFPPYGVLLEQGHNFLYLLIYITIYAMSCVFYSLCGLCISAIFPNGYVAVCTPFIASYLLEQTTDNFPDCLDFYNIAIGAAILSESHPILDYLYAIGLFGACSILVSLIYRSIVRKRVQHEIH